MKGYDHEYRWTAINSPGRLVLCGHEVTTGTSLFLSKTTLLSVLRGPSSCSQS